MMSTIDEYNHAMELVKEVERGPVSKFSAETRCYADLVRAVENYHRETQKRADQVQAELDECKEKLALMEKTFISYVQDDAAEKCRDLSWDEAKAAVYRFCQDQAEDVVARLNKQTSEIESTPRVMTVRQKSIEQSELDKALEELEAIGWPCRLAELPRKYNELSRRYVEMRKSDELRGRRITQLENLLKKHGVDWRKSLFDLKREDPCAFGHE